MRYFEHPLITYLIVVIFSFIAASFFAYLGGRVAEVSGVTPLMGLTFQASGALAGFLIIVAISAYWLERLQKERKKISYITLFLTNGEEKFSKDVEYKCEYQIFDLTTGDRTIFKEIKHRWDNDFLTLDIRNISPNNLIAIKVNEIKDGQQNKICETEHLPLNSHTIDAKNSKFITGLQR